MKKVIALSAMVALGLLAFALPASAAPAPAPLFGTQPVPGSPAHVCAYLTGTPLVHDYLVNTYPGLIDTFSGCVRTFAHGTPIVADEVNEPDGFGGNAYAQCASLETQGIVTYPFVFTEGPDAPFPLFVGANRAECSRILFALHATGVSLGGPN